MPQHSIAGWMHPANEPHTEHRMRITLLEVRVDKLEQRTTEGTDSKLEPRKAVSTLIKEWQPLLVALIVLAGVMLGKLTFPEALALLKGGP